MTDPVTDPLPEIKRNSVCILVAEDDDEDFLLIKKSFEQVRLANRIRRVKDGEDLLAYLRRRGLYAEPGAAPRPGIILLDLNMPRMDGREALKRIKADPELRQIPVIALTTSKSEEDVLDCYKLGVSSYIRKPVRFETFVQTVSVLGCYWLDIVELPDGETP